MKRAVIYARQSVEKEEGERSLSLDSQVELLRADAEREGWSVVEVVVEAGLKGWQDADERPGLGRVVALARKRACEVVMVYDLSRLARKLRYQEQWLDEFEDLGVEPWSHREPWVNVKVMRQVVGALNEEQTRIISANTRRGQLQWHERGLVWGRRPYGYRSAGAPGSAEPDPAAAAVVAELFARVAGGESLSSVTAWLNRRGLPSPRGAPRWSLCTVGRILANPAYRGVLHYGGHEREGGLPAIVDEQTWWLAQRRFRQPRQAKRWSSWAEGLVDHQCGARMYLGELTTRAAYERVGFRCRYAWRPELQCRARPLSMEQGRLEREGWQAVGEALAKVLDPDEVHARLRREVDEAEPGARDRLRQLEREERRWHERLAIAEELLLEQRRGRAWFDEEEGRVRQALEAIAAERAAMPALPEAGELRRAASLLRGVARTLEQVTEAEHRRQVVAAVGRLVVEGVGRRCDKTDCGRVRVAWHPEYGALLPAE